MTRVGDGLRLGWRILDMEGEAVQFTYSGGYLSEGNLLLPREGGAAGAGAESIRAGDRFDLVVAVDGTEIHGTTHVPVRPEIRVSETEGRTIFSWSPVPGAAAYEASFQGADGIYDGLPLGPDTLFVLDRPVREGDRLWVTAYEPEPRRLRPRRNHRQVRARHGLRRLRCHGQHGQHVLS